MISCCSPQMVATIDTTTTYTIENDLTKRKKKKQMTYMSLPSKLFTERKRLFPSVHYSSAMSTALLSLICAHYLVKTEQQNMHTGSVLSVSVRDGTAYRGPFHAACKFCENELKA